MERIIIRHATLLKTLKTLAKPLKKLETLQKDNELYDLIRDSLIQRFEYTFEAAWQFLKQLLEEKYDVKTAGTRDIFRESLRLGLITEQELDVFLKMVLDRNETVHAYKEQVAQAIAEDIPAYFELITTIANRLKP